jgi:hypothetical protein
MSEPAIVVRVFQYRGPVMGVFNTSDPRPGKANVNSAVMSIDVALHSALHVARCRSINRIVIDDPRALLFPFAA